MSREIGLRLKEIRTHLKMTQAQFGKKLDLKASAVAKYENGVNLPKGKILQALVSHYNVSLDYLVTGKGNLFMDDEDIQQLNRSKSIPEGDRELEDLFSLVTKIPWVRHVVLGHFQKFKLENRELIEKELKSGE